MKVWSIWDSSTQGSPIIYVRKGGGDFKGEGQEYFDPLFRGEEDVFLPLRVRRSWILFDPLL